MNGLNIGIIGCGQAALMHSRTISSIAPRAQRFYASRSSEKACGFNERFGGSGWFNSYDAAFADPRIDVILILTPPETHAELAIAALRAGKHVIVEKPAFMSVGEFTAVRAEADLADRRVLVAENYPYKPLTTLLRDIIANGDIGEFRLALVNALKWQRPAGWRLQPGMTPLFEGGIHWISLLASLGPAIAGISTTACDSALTTLTTLRYDNGAMGVLAYSWEMKSTFRGLRISRLYGTRGSVAFESNGVGLAVRGARSRVAFPGFRDIAGYRAMFSDLLGAIAGDLQPRYTLEHAQRDVELLTSSTVEVPSWT